MAGAHTVIAAPTLPELQARVEEWYQGAAAQGLEDARIPWDPDQAQKSDDGGFEFIVWAHS